MAKLATIKLTGEAYDLLIEEAMKRKLEGNRKWAMKSIVTDLIIKEFGKE